MATRAHFKRQLLLSCDAKGYGSGDDQRQFAVQDGLLAVLDDAADRAALNRAGWIRQSTGDGELALLPGEQESRVVDDFVHHLAGALARHNRDLRPEARLRMRLAIHFGAAMDGGNGFVGQGIVAVSRLVDSNELRAVLASTEADLVVVLSAQVFRDTVAQGHTSLHVEDFRRVGIANKEFVEDAWVLVPGQRPGGTDPGQSAPVQPATPTGPPQPASPAADAAGTAGAPGGMTANFHRDVNVNGILGVYNG